jgi:hypothetical protein
MRYKEFTTKVRVVFEEAEDHEFVYDTHEYKVSAALNKLIAQLPDQVAILELYIDGSPFFITLQPSSEGKGYKPETEDQSEDQSEQEPPHEEDEEEFVEDDPPIAEPAEEPQQPSPPIEEPEEDPAPIQGDPPVEEKREAGRLSFAKIVLFSFILGLIFASTQFYKEYQSGKQFSESLETALGWLFAVTVLTPSFILLAFVALLAIFAKIMADAVSQKQKDDEAKYKYTIEPDDDEEDDEEDEGYINVSQDQGGRKRRKRRRRPQQQEFDPESARQAYRQYIRPKLDPPIQKALDQLGCSTLLVGLVVIVIAVVTLW